MRDNIYYWKCDNPLSDAAKTASYFKEKYDRAGLTETVARACRQVFGAAFQDVAPLRVDGSDTRLEQGRRLYDRKAYLSGNRDE